MSDGISGINIISPSYPVKPVQPAKKDREPGNREKNPPNSESEPEPESEEEGHDHDKPAIDEYV